MTPPDLTRGQALALLSEHGFEGDTPAEIASWGVRNRHLSDAQLRRILAALFPPPDAED